MYDIQAIKQRIDCVAVAQRCNLPIRKAGDRCVSPLRPGATNNTSFVVYSDFWFDHGSAHGGDAIDLMAELQYGGDKGAAIRELARITCVESVDDNTGGWYDYTQALCDRIAHYQTKLTHDDYAYLQQRGLTFDTIAALRIGRNEEGRLVIPYTKNGYVAYYCTRAMPGCQFPESKYRKMRIDDYNEHIVWGLDSLSRTGDTLVIAEGVFDAISFWQEGYPVLSAVTGFFSRDQLSSVLQAAKMFSRVFIVYDNDKRTHAGDKFCEKMARIFLKERIPFVVGHVPDEYKDISEYYEDGGSLQQLVATAMNGLSYVCNTYTDFEELARFLRPLARVASAERITMLFKDLRDNGRFGATELKELRRIVTAPPSEGELHDVVRREHQLIHVEGIGFHEWNGHVWEHLHDNVVRGYVKDVMGGGVSASRVKNVCDLLKCGTPGEIAFDSLPVLTFRNGTLELETGTFRDHSPYDYCTITMDYDYAPNASCPEWEQFIEDVTNGCGEREENLQFLPGYALMPHCKYQKIFILLGGGGNGKSVYLDVLQRVFGRNNISTVEPSTLPQDFQRITIKNSLLNIGADISTDFAKGEVREWLLKIADGATIQACYKGKDYIKFNPRCKLVFACNTIPNAEVVNGLDRRLQFVEFVCRFVEYPDPKDETQKQRDVNIMDKLIAELPGIFNWCYKGYRDLKRQGYFVETPEQQRLLDEFRVISNPIQAYCDDHIFEGRMTRDEVYASYKEWCENTGHRTLSREKFMPKFKETMGKKILDDSRLRLNGKRTLVFSFASEGQCP